MTVQEWQALGTYHQIGEHKVFTVEAGEGDATLVILHGYPSASFDYYKVLEVWKPHFRVIIHDHLGYGFSDKPKNYSYSLIEQAEVAQQLWQKLGVKKAHLLAHDYGTSVATEIIYRRNIGIEPVTIQSATLGNGSMLIEMASLLLSQKLLYHPFFGPLLVKLSSRGYFKYNMRKIWWDKSKCNDAELDILWGLLEANGGRKVLPKITQYIPERFKFWNRWIANGLYKTDLPINLLWADKDPVAVVEMAHELHKNIPNNRLQILKDIGHYPMLEAPEVYGKAVLELILGNVST
ncbi:MAG: pimeloyl-ACP methyl ester carboxylesterase [Paraglaciecola sp.]|jgi:pimeloyl-ACP methyl ester carboxylesterase